MFTGVSVIVDVRWPLVKKWGYINGLYLVYFDGMDHVIHEFAQFLRHHLTSISVGVIATLLTIHGATINGYFKRITKSIPFVGRFALFVVLCSAGYAFLSSQAVRFLRKFLMTQADLPLIGMVTGVFLVLAIMAYWGKDV